jgi:hypothetical protein
VGQPADSVFHWGTDKAASVDTAVPAAGEQACRFEHAQVS